MAFRNIDLPKSTKGRFFVKFYGANLKILNRELFNRVVNQTSDSLTGYVAIDINKLDEETRGELAAALPLMGKMVPPGSMEENEQYNRAVMDVATRKARQEAQIAEGDAMVQAYVKQGLIVNDRNKALLTEHIQKNSGIFCAASVRAAVEGERANLQWNKVEKPATPQQPAEPLVTLSDGSKQLPLNTTPAKHHTIAQLRDLDARQCARRSRHAGTFGARF
jgi:hypothetical protein